MKQRPRQGTLEERLHLQTIRARYPRKALRVDCRPLGEWVAFRHALRKEPKLGPVRKHIDQMLEMDGEAPRKQRHTVHRIWMRLRSERPQHQIGEPTARRARWLAKLGDDVLASKIAVANSFRMYSGACGTAALQQVVG